MRTNVDTGTISLQAAIKEDVELTRVVEDDLTREGYVSGEFLASQNLIVIASDKVELMEHR